MGEKSGTEYFHFAVIADNLYYYRLAVGCTRIKKGLDNPSMGKRKASPDNNLHSKWRRTTKIISRKICSASGSKCGSGADYFMDQGAIIPVSMKGVTPIKCHVAERQVPPSPFELNLIPRTISISVIEKMYKKFEEGEC